MRKGTLIGGLLAAISTSVAMAGPLQTIEEDACKVDPRLDSAFKVCKAPEMDPSSAIAALTLLAGGIAIVVGARTKRLKSQAG